MEYNIPRQAETPSNKYVYRAELGQVIPLVENVNDLSSTSTRPKHSRTPIANHARLI